MEYGKTGVGMTTGMQKKHERMPMSPEQRKKMMDLRDSFSSAQQGIDTNKMKQAVGNLVSRKPVAKKPPRGLAEREVQMGRLQDAKNLAAMMKRQRAGG